MGWWQRREECRHSGFLSYPISMVLSTISVWNYSRKRNEINQWNYLWNKENEIVSTAAGTVKQVVVNKGQTVNNQDTIIIVG